jgi:hypothetical protein
LAKMTTKTKTTIIFAPIGCLIATLTCAPAMAGDAQRLHHEISTMQNPLNQAAQLLNLPEADFFAFNDDRQTQMQHALAQIADQGTPPDAPLLALGAPAHVDAERPNASIPLLIGSVQSGLRAWQVNFNTNLHVFARNLSSGTLVATEPFVSARRGGIHPRSGVGAPPSPIDAQTRYTEISPVNLLAKLETGLTPGNYIVTAVADDLRSNSVTMHLIGETPSSQPVRPVPQAYLRHKLVTQTDLPNRVEVPTTVQKNDPILVRVAMRIGVEDGILDAEKHPIWPCHVILVKLDAHPDIIPAWIPVQTISAPNRPIMFNAVFQIDLRAAARSPLSGKYQLYIDVGRGLVGPYPFITEN